MKHKAIKSQTIIMLVLLLLAVIYVTGVTYSYFSSTSNTNGEVELGGVDFYFYYNSNPILKSNTLELVPADGLIEREVPFGLKLKDGSEKIETFGITAYSASSAYIRFWIDAYIIENEVVDKTVNYGKYFYITESNNYIRGDQTSSCSVNGSTCYFIKNSQSGSTTMIPFGNTLTLKDISAEDPVPLGLLGEQIKITISFEAVQVANGAYKSVFADDKGYLKSWA